MSADKAIRITLIGVGTIGLSFAALHISQNENAEVIIHDTRPNIEEYIRNALPG